MRQIKFRGKDRKTGKWVYGDLLTPITGCRIVNYREEDNGSMKRADYDYHDVLDDTVSQFTGLRDCNGKEIYEGDILKSPCNNIVAVEFGYHEDIVRLKGMQFDDSFAAYGWIVRNLENGMSGLLDNSFLQGEIVGNIHDNTELMTKGQSKRRMIWHL